METWHLYEALSPSGKRYIGITSRALAARRKNHGDAVKAGSATLFHNALRKHGDAFAWRILKTGSKEFILALEIAVIEALKTRDRRFGYNLSLGGELSPSLVPETAAKISASNKGRQGRKLSDAEIAVIRARNADPEFQARRIAAIKTKCEEPERKTQMAARGAAVGKANQGRTLDPTLSNWQDPRGPWTPKHVGRPRTMPDGQCSECTYVGRLFAKGQCSRCYHRLYWQRQRIIPASSVDI